MKSCTGRRGTSISAAVKQAVRERDGGRCVLCGRPGNPWCHYISRAQGGLGRPENIVTLCDKCHRRFDQSADRAALKDAGELSEKQISRMG
ncbi:MAG: HNH endonuclease [Oscillospiraceae bacterium]